MQKETTGTNAYPDTPAEAKLAQSQDNTVLYVKKPYGYCVSAANPRAGKTLVLYSTTKAITEGTCTAEVSTFAGSGSSAYTDGKGTAAQFESPSGITAGSDGTLYVSDYHRIRKISSDGTVSFLSGSGTSGSLNGNAATAQFNQPGRLTLDSTGALYAVENFSHMIRKVDVSTGAVTTLVGADEKCNYSRGSTTDGLVSVARLDGPTGIIRDSAGTLYISEGNSQRIRSLLTTGTVSTYAGSGNLNACVASVAQPGYTNGDRLLAMFNNPTDIVVDKNDTLYVADAGNNAIRTISKSGVVSTLTNTLSGNQQPRAIAIDSQGTVYSAGYYGIFSVTPAGVVTTIAGSINAGGFTNGNPTAARFENIRDITLSADETALFVVDSSNYSIRKISL